MNFWINLWTLFFLISLALFGGLAVIVSVGGFFDIRALFKTLTDGAEQEEDKRSALLSEQSRKDRKDEPEKRKPKQ